MESVNVQSVSAAAAASVARKPPFRPTNISNRHLTTKKLNPVKTNW